MTTVYIGDALETLRQMAAQSVQCCITSPPYFGLRDYGVAGQMGHEKTSAEYVRNLVAVFREVRRVLRDDGTLWLNLGDCYNSGASGGLGGSTLQGGQKNQEASNRSKARRKMAAGVKHKDLIGIPWMVAFALRDDGWYLRQDIIWHKPNAMPASVTDRCTTAHEYVFLLSKSSRYYFNDKAIQTPASDSFAKDPRHLTGSNDRNDKDGYVEAGAQNPKGPHRVFGQGAGPKMVNKRSVWRVPTKPFKGAHFAVFPPELIRPCVLAGSPVGSIVLDPFGGSGTTAEVCLEEGRSSILIDINPNCPQLLTQRLQKKDLTEIPKCVNLSTPAQCDGQQLNPIPQMHFSQWDEPSEGFYGGQPNKTITMNPKLFGLLCTIAATALTQMANACGGPAEDTPAPKAPKKQAKVAEPEPEEEEDADVTVEVEDDDAPDYAAMKKQMMTHIRKLWALEDGGLKARKEKLRGILASFKEANIGDADDKNVPGLLAAVLKLK